MFGSGGVKGGVRKGVGGDNSSTVRIVSSIKNTGPRLVIPTGILRIPVFSSPVALFLQESRFLFFGNYLGTLSGILSVPGLLYQAYVHRNSCAPLQNHVPPKNSSGKHRKKKKF
jgi:hypothetical protein